MHLSQAKNRLTSGTARRLAITLLAFIVLIATGLWIAGRSLSPLLRSRAIAACEKYGSERQSDKVPILSSFLESNKFSLGDGHALRFQQQVVQVLVPPASSAQGLDIAIDGLYHPETNLHAAVIENSTEMID